MHTTGGDISCLSIYVESALGNSVNSGIIICNINCHFLYPIDYSIVDANHAVSVARAVNKRHTFPVIIIPVIIRLIHGKR